MRPVPLELLLLGFRANKQEWIKFHNWAVKQPSNSSYSYVFTPTGIGTSIQVVNIKTGKSINITDYESW